MSGKQLEHALAGLVLPDIKLPKAQVLQTYPIHEDLSDESKPNPFQSNAFSAPTNLKLRQAIPGTAAANKISQGTAITESKYDIQPIQNEINFTQIIEPSLKRNVKKLWERTLQISKLLDDLFDHSAGLPGPNANTDKSIKGYISDIEKLEDKITDIMGSLADKLASDPGGNLALSKISDALEGLTKQANNMRNP